MIKESFIIFNNNKLPISTSFAVFLCYIGTAIAGYINYIIGDYAVTLLYFIPIYFAIKQLDKAYCRLFTIISSIINFIIGALVYSGTSVYGGYGFTLVSLRTWNSVETSSIILLTGYLFYSLRYDSKQLDEAANIDYLTGLLNRSSFYKLAGYELTNCRRYGRQFTAALIDIDDFKSINDTYGHDVGDQVIKIVAVNIRNVLRNSDIIARVGGDDFIVMLPETGAGSIDVFNKIVKSINSKFVNKPCQINLSIGAVTFNTPPKSVDEMLTITDSKMYVAKMNGKNNISHYVSYA